MNTLLDFLENSPTAWHAAANIETIFNHHGFIQLDERDSWELSPGKSYYVTRDGSSLCAFVNPIEKPSSSLIVASHLDSPALKIKPNPEIRKNNMVLLGVEVYGAPLLSSWLNRDLGIAGRVAYEDSQGNWRESLVDIRDFPLVIPQLAVHLDREVNEKGLVLNKQDHLNALAALDDNLPTGSYLEAILRSQIDLKTLYSHDLFLYPLEKPRFIGYERQMISSYRIDSLASVHATVEAFLENAHAHHNRISMVAFWNSEEIGSHTYQGASSPFVSQVLERILLQSGLGRDDYWQLINRSFCVSVDLAHALHPNYPEKHDAQHQVILGKGVVLKSHAQHRYATDMRSSRFVHQVAKKIGETVQKFVSRNDMPCGTTIGPLHSGTTGMLTVDIGCSQLSMHSAREVMACKDQQSLQKLLSAFFSDTFVGNYHG